VISWIKLATEADAGINPFLSLESPIPEGNPGSFDIAFESSSGLFGFGLLGSLGLRVSWDALNEYWDDKHYVFNEFW